jgi:hypothetical protein
MGLGFSHGNAHWSYSGFHGFRLRLAAEIGINLDEMQGFSDDSPIPWDTVDDPIKDLLYHSDCDGELSPRQCLVVAPRLAALVASWPDNDYDKINAMKMVLGMEDARNTGKPFVFC